MANPARISSQNNQEITGVIQAPINVRTANKQGHSTGQGVPTSPGSQATQSSDPVLKKQQADSQGDTNYDQRPEGDLSNEFFTRLVQRYTDLCHQRQILQEEIDDQIERKERLAAEKLRCAKIHLETIREKAVEIVAVLNETSEGDTQVRLPAGTLDETHVVSPIDLCPKNANNSRPLPLDAPPPLSPVTDSTLTEPVPDNTSPKTATIVTVVGSVPCPLPSMPRGAAIGQLTKLISELRGGTPAPPPPLPPLPLPAPAPALKKPSNVTATQQAIFMKYDELMKAAKAVGATVLMSTIPWPLLVPHAHQYPMQNVVEKSVLRSNVIGFFDLYSRWKGWNLRNDCQPMREDWEKLLLVIPEHIPWGRVCIAKVVWVLRELVPDKSGD